MALALNRSEIQHARGLAGVLDFRDIIKVGSDERLMRAHSVVILNDALLVPLLAANNC